MAKGKLKGVVVDTAEINVPARMRAFAESVEAVDGHIVLTVAQIGEMIALNSKCLWSTGEEALAMWLHKTYQMGVADALNWISRAGTDAGILRFLRIHLDCPEIHKQILDFQKALKNKPARGAVEVETM